MSWNPYRDRTELANTVEKQESKIADLRDQVASRNDRLRSKAAREDERISKRGL